MLETHASAKALESFKKHYHVPVLNDLTREGETELGEFNLGPEPLDYEKGTYPQRYFKNWHKDSVGQWVCGEYDSQDRMDGRSVIIKNGINIMRCK
jgi:hypothetical protein